MKAAFHDTSGGPDVLRVGDLPDAIAGPDEVLVRARASSLDRVDVYFRAGTHGMRIRPPHLPHIGGRDVAGLIDTIGPLAQGRYPELRVGQPVVGVAVRAAHAELVAVPAALVLPLPEGCSFEEAAALPTAGRTAYDGLINRGRLRAGDTALVIAAGSGVGSFGIQIARAAGARVIATVGSAWKAEQAGALGVSDVIDHHRQDIAVRVRELTEDRGADVALDPVGAATFPVALDALAREGRYVTTGVTAGYRAELHLGRVFERGLTVTGVGRPDNERIRAVMQHLLALVARGAVRPAISEVVPLEEIARAHALLEGGAVFGKIVVTVAP